MPRGKKEKQKWSKMVIKKRRGFGQSVMFFMEQVRDIRHQLASSLAQQFVVVVVGQCDSFLALTTKLYNFPRIFFFFGIIILVCATKAKDDDNVVGGLCTHFQHALIRLR